MLTPYHAKYFAHDLTRRAVSGMDRLSISLFDAAVDLNPHQIAEGAERGGKDFIRFLTIARGSAAELRTQCYIASKIGILTSEQMNQLVSELKEISKMLTGLARSIKARTEN